MFLLDLLLLWAALTGAVQAVVFEDCVPITWEPAPNSILRYISCKCKKGCQRNCGCRKVGLHCSPICTSCEGLCDNVEPPEDSSDIDTEKTQERDRGSAYELDEVNIDGCGMRLPCVVTLGENVPVNVKFYAGFSSTQLEQDVVININLLNLRTNVTPEPCQTVHCPVRTNAVTSFTSVMTVPTNMALNQRGHLRWRVYNEQGRQVLCYAVLVQTQSPLQKIMRQAMARAQGTSTYSDNRSNIAKIGNTELSYLSYLENIMNRHYQINSR